MDILKLARLPESNTLEFKRDSSSLEPILRSVIAFANTAGGILLIGVDDDGTLVGLLDPSKIQEQISSSIAHRIKPQIIPDFHIMETDEKSVLVIQVDPLPAPYYLTDKGEDNGTYIRLGNTNRLAGHEVIAEMKRAKHHPFYDKLPCDKVLEEDLDNHLLIKTFSERHVPLDTAKLLSIGVLTHKGRRVVASNGGVILFGKTEVHRTHFPFAEVRCARFAGATRAEFIDRLEIEGGILPAVDEVPKFIRRNTKVAGKFGGMQRRDIPEYPIEGIREALTNALVHANYEVSGTRIFVAIYDDKLEIQNPGRMPPGMDIEQFKAGVSRIRNPVIARVFGELGLMEEWGSGYKRIKEACQKGGYPEPIWEELGTVMRVTFFPHPAVIGTKSGPSRDQVGTKLELDEELIKLLELCRESTPIVNLMESLGWQNRTKFRKKYIEPLVAAGYLEMIYPDKPSSRKQKYRLTAMGEQRLSNE